jgi:7tm Chemosensory receptor
METACGYYYSAFTFLCFQPQRNMKKFFALRALQTVALTWVVLKLYLNRDNILYQKDFLGSLADVNKLLVAVFVSFIILLEPVIRFRDYQKIEILSEKFCASLKTFRHEIDGDMVFSQMRRNLTVGIAVYVVIFVISECLWISTSLNTSQSQMFYLAFILPVILHQLKTLQHVVFLMFIGAKLKILKFLVREVNQDVTINQDLKSEALNEIIRNKYQKVFCMYENVLESIQKLNSSIGISQLVMLTGCTFYLIGDFYWLAFVTLHKKIELKSTFS